MLSLWQGIEIFVMINRRWVNWKRRVLMNDEIDAKASEIRSTATALSEPAPVVLEHFEDEAENSFRMNLWQNVICH